MSHNFHSTVLREYDIRGIIGDTTARAAITGPCRVSWRDGLAALVRDRLGGSDGTSEGSQGIAGAASRLLDSFGIE